MIHALFQKINKQGCDNNNDRAINSEIVRDKNYNPDQVCPEIDFVEELSNGLLKYLHDYIDQNGMEAFKASCKEGISRLDGKALIYTRIGDVQKHNILVGRLEELGIPVAYCRFEDPQPNMPYVLFWTKIKEADSPNGKFCYEEYEIELFSQNNSEHEQLSVLLKNTIIRYGYTFRDEYSIIDTKDNKRRMILLINESTADKPCDVKQLQ